MKVVERHDCDLGGRGQWSCEHDSVCDVDLWGTNGTDDGDSVVYVVGTWGNGEDDVDLWDKE